MTTSVDVVIVGAGPTGLTAAGDLARAGRTVVVLEKRPTPNPSSRAFATMARTLEVLDGRGLADDLIAPGHRAPGVSVFAGAQIDLSHLDSPYPFVLVTPQTNVDRTLLDYAQRYGADVRRGVEVVGIDQDADGVTVTARSQDSSRDIAWRADYVVGADGAHSTVRELLRIDFPGRTILSSLVLADVKLSDGPAGGSLTVGSTRDVFGFLAPYERYDADGSCYRAMLSDRHHQVPDHVPANRAEISGALARAFDTAPVWWTSTGRRDSIATKGRSRSTGTAAFSLPGTPHTCTPPWAGRG